jgi:murein DD-endopeptidase MepM/ murein hydrolase activator NlpD
LRFDVLDTATTQAGAIGSSSIDSIVVAVRPEAVPVIAPPVRGEWLAGNGPANGSDHRMAMIALDGRVSIAQRFAIDWVMVGPNGNTFHDTASRSENYWDFGQPVYAVADGEVVAVVDSIADNVPHTPLPPVTLANIAGNYVVLRIAPQRYALFAHLQRGSVRVRPQERVRRGAVLGLVGNSGQTTGPHLHFQIMDGPSPLASEGVPFVLDRFTFLGFGRDFEPDQHPTVAHTREMPVDDSVLLLP